MLTPDIAAHGGLFLLVASLRFKVMFNLRQIIVSVSKKARATVRGSIIIVRTVLSDFF